jgi:hypothetical protein
MLTLVKTSYLVNSTEIEDEIGKRAAFGVDIKLDNKKLHSLYDISNSSSFIERLVNLFNRNELSLSHIYDVLEDIL